MRANVWQKYRIMATVIFATLRITAVVLYRVYLRGGYPRPYGDNLLKWWAEKCLGAVRLRYRVTDPGRLEIEPGRRYIIMCNHRSQFDIPLMMLTLPGSVRMLTKKELFKVPLWGRGMKAGEFIAIDRSDLEQAKKDLASAREKMESGIVLWVAPEGTRSRSGRLGSFKKGGFIMAIESGATIIPVGINGTEKALVPKTLEFHFDQDAVVSIGSPIEASEYTLDRKEELMERVRASIAALSGEPETDRAIA